MCRSPLFLLLVVVTIANKVSAFHYASTQRISKNRNAMRMTTDDNILQEIKESIGALPPLGYFDPVGFMKDCDMEQFEAVRERELKHGRICMLAFLGNLLNSVGIRLPGGLHPEGGPYDVDGVSIPFSSIHSGLAALQDIPTTGLAQIIFLIGLLELGYGSRKKLIGEVHIEKAIERFNWNDEIIAEQKAKELNNGRGAMIGMLGIFTHEAIGQSPFQPLL